MPSRPIRTYRIVPAKDGTYAIEASSHGEAPLIISGFKSEKEAARWIESYSPHEKYSRKDDDT